MNPGLLLLLLVACLLALLPTWRLRVAGWPARWLLAAWLAYAVTIVLAVRFAAAFRFLLPVLVLAYIAPFIAGPERLARVLRRRTPPRPVIDVTPRPAPGLPAPDASAGPGDTDRDDASVDEDVRRDEDDTNGDEDARPDDASRRPSP
jgi:hypothetical protein